VTALPQLTGQRSSSRATPGRASSRRRATRRLWAAGSVLAVVVLAVSLAPLLAHGSPDAQDLSLGAIPPLESLAHPLGTDQLGRDLLARLLYGGRSVLVVAGLAAVLAGVVGLALGMLAGYVSGAADTILSRVTEIQLAIPTILLAIVVIGMGATGVPVLVLVLVLAEWPLFFRLSRGLVSRLRTQAYVTAAKTYGASSARIVVKHLGRAVLPTAVIAFTLTLANAIALAASLSYIGLGVQPPQSDWGSMVAQGQSELASSWWIAVLPGLAIAVFVYAANRLGDGLSTLWSTGRTQGDAEIV